MAQTRYIGNQRSRVGHDRTNLKERCNTDQITDRAAFDESGWLKALERGWRACKLCGGPRDYR